MIMKRYYKLFFILFSVEFFGCFPFIDQKVYEEITIKNNSRDTLVVDTYFSEKELLDLNYHTDVYLCECNLATPIKPGQTKSLRTDFSIVKFLRKSGSIDFYVFKLQDLKKYERIDSLYFKNLYVKKTYNRIQLDSLKWMVTIMDNQSIKEN